MYKKNFNGGEKIKGQKIQFSLEYVLYKLYYTQQTSCCGTLAICSLSCTVHVM